MSFIFFPLQILLNIVLSKYFLFFIIVWTILSYFILKTVFKSIQKYAKANEELYIKYPNFMRKDWSHWDFNKLFIGMVLFAWIKIPLVLLTIVGAWVAIKVVTYGKNIEEADQKLKEKIQLIGKIAGRSFLLSCGIFVDTKEVSVDYTKYLGKDYEKKENHYQQWSRCAATISNHVSWLDIMILIGQKGNGFITSDKVASFPFVGTVCTWLGSIYVSRLDKESRANTIKMLDEKMKNIALNKEYSELAIFPEGTTSNGRYLLPFKQGAFMNFLPLKPLVIEIDSLSKISLAMDIIEMTTHVIIVCCVLYHSVTLYSIPDFYPTKYFIEEYIPSVIQEQQKPWQVYAEVMRTIMNQVSNISKGNQTYEDKVQLLDILRNKKEVERTSETKIE